MTELQEAVSQAEAYFRASHEAAYEAFRLYDWKVPSMDYARHFHCAAREALEAAYAYSKLAMLIHGGEE